MDNFWKLAAVLVCVALESGAFAQGPSFNVPPGGSPFNPAGAPVVTTLMSAVGLTSPSATSVPSASNKPEIGIAEAAGTVTDPADFIYLSKEYVFNLLVVANTFGIPGVQFDPDSLPTLTEPQSDTGNQQPNVRMRATTTGGSRSRTSAPGGLEIVQMSGSGSGQRAVRGAQFLAGEEENTKPAPVAPSDADSGQMLKAITVSNNEDLSKLLDMVKDLPSWDRVARIQLQTTQKQKLDKAISGIYAQAYRMLNSGAPMQGQYGAPAAGGIPGTYISDGESGRGTPPPNPEVAPAPVMQQGPPPIDPQAMGEWFYYYQQSVAWERYVNEEVLILKPGEPTNMYNLDTAIQPQELFMAPRTPNSPTPIIHFGAKETPIAMRISSVKPSSIQPALDQMSRVMEDLATQNAKKDSDRSRVFVADLEVRKERRFRYREWLNDQTTEIHKLAEDYRRRLAGNEFVIDGVQYLVSQKPLRDVPLGSRNIVTERLTPYDLLDSDGTLKKATEATVEQTP